MTIDPQPTAADLALAEEICELERHCRDEAEKLYARGISANVAFTANAIFRIIARRTAEQTTKPSAEVDLCQRFYDRIEKDINEHGLHNEWRLERVRQTVAWRQRTIASAEKGAP